MEKFFLPFLYSFAASILAIPLLLRIGKKYKNIKRISGGVVILIFVLGVLFNKNLVITPQILGIIIGGLLILVFGFWDDLKNLSWKWQLLFQIIIAIVAISFGVRSLYLTNPSGGIINLQNPFLYYSLFSIFYLLFINSLNWLDGVDGLSGSVTLVALFTIFFLSFKPEVNQPAVAILTAISAGAILGLLVFNWAPAKILAGTAGAWFFGFLLASFSIFAGAKVATVLMVALIPILDFFYVIWERWQAGEPIVKEDDRHLHYRLIKLGLSKTEITLMVSAATALVGIIALNASAMGKIFFAILLAAIYFAIARILSLKCRNFEN